MKILDGTGHGNWAKVNEQNALLTTALTENTTQFAAQNRGEHFLFTMPMVDVTTTEGLIAWMYNSSTTDSIQIFDIYLGWNGGSTNYNTPLYVRFEMGTGQPTTGIEAGSARNTNSTKSNTSETTILQWDGSTGTGITGHTPGLTVFRTIVAQGETKVAGDGTTIVGPGITLGLYVQASDQTGKFATNVSFIQSDFKWTR